MVTAQEMKTVAIRSGNETYDVYITPTDQPGVDHLEVSIKTDFNDTETVVGKLQQCVNEVAQHLRDTEAKPRD